MPQERLMRIRIPVQVWRFLTLAAEAHGYDDAGELVEVLLVELFHRYHPKRRRPRRETAYYDPAGTSGAPGDQGGRSGARG